MDDPAKRWVGSTWGRLIVLEHIPSTGKIPAKLLCKCSCGIERIVVRENVRKGATKSCGCLRSELSSARGKEVKHEWRKYVPQIDHATLPLESCIKITSKGMLAT